MTLPTLLTAAIERRAALLQRLAEGGTDCVRLMHGATEGAEGMTVDRYGRVLLVQTWRESLDTAEPLLDAANEALVALGHPPMERLRWTHRPRGTGAPPPGLDTGEGPETGTEGGLLFDVSPEHRGRDPLLFLDLRAGRSAVRAASEGASVLNLFSYTCGVGLAAAAGGAREVWNVDFATSALAVGRANGDANQLPQQYVQEDFFVLVRQLAGLPVGGRGRPRHTRYAPRSFELVVLDPPRRARSRFGVVDVVGDYPSLLKPAVLATEESGTLLITNHVASVDPEDWRALCVRCIEKAGRVVRDWRWIPPDEDFPSPDQNPPLKMAWLSL